MPCAHHEINPVLQVEGLLAPRYLLQEREAFGNILRPVLAVWPIAVLSNMLASFGSQKAGFPRGGPGIAACHSPHSSMPNVLTWQDVALRLLFTFVAGGIIGFNRDERGHSAGLRTNLLVALSACIAMILANELIVSTGKTSDSFVTMDIMRLPLGILTGIGFIGAGAILKRGETVTGLTTAATLWFGTVMGLCFGAGRLALGTISFALGLLILSALKVAEYRLPREHRAGIRLFVSPEGPDMHEIQSLFARSGVSFGRPSFTSDFSLQGGKEFSWEIRWKTRRGDNVAPSIIQDLAEHAGIRRLEFTERG